LARLVECGYGSEDFGIRVIASLTAGTGSNKDGEERRGVVREVSSVLVSAWERAK